MQKKISSLKIAVVYDHLLTEYGGAELVLETLLEAFPNAELFTTVRDHNKTNWVGKTTVHTSFLQHFMPLIKQRELLDFFTPIALEQFDFSEFDAVISVTSSAAKGVLTSPKQLHLCYLLTPTRYLYHDTEELLSSHRILSLPIIHFFAKKVLAYLRWWDQVAVQRPDKIIVISQQVAARLEKFNNRKADQLIYPPVTLPAKVISQNKPLFPGRYFLSISRLMPYKHVDRAITSCLKLEKTLIIIGEGPEEKRLIQQAGSNGLVRQPRESVVDFLFRASQSNKTILFVQSCSETAKNILLQYCVALIQPGIEDFGITALEANAAGKPVIISSQSGVAEIIADSQAGIHLKTQTVVELTSAIEKIEKIKLDQRKIQHLAARFSREEFVRKFHNFFFAFFQEHSTINH